MKSGLSLRSKVLALAAINALLLAAFLVWFARTQLTQDLGSLLLGESRERITEVALQLAKELKLTATKDRDELLGRYSKAHGVTFLLFHQNSKQLAGPAVTLPKEVLDYFAALQAKSPLANRPDVTKGTVGERFKLDPAELDRMLLIVKDPPFFTAGGGNYWVTFRLPLQASDKPQFVPAQLVLRTESFFGTPFFFDLTPWIGLAAGMLLIALLCWLPFVRRTTRSIGSLAGATSKVARGDFSAKVAVHSADELGELEASFNRMAGQLEGYVHGQKRFLRDAAHELRSPLARMQAALGNMAESGVGSEAEPFLEDLREEIDLMSALTAELLTFAREENAQGRRKLVAVDLPALVGRVMNTENPHHAADVRVQVAAGLTVAAHPESLFRGLSNVVRNAIRYAGDAGPITLAAERRDDGTTVVTVSDQGPGIPEEALEMVFTPFYRLDVSRDRKTGGNGLGMAISRSCVESSQGTIYCRNRNPGLEVIVTLRSMEQPADTAGLPDAGRGKVTPPDLERAVERQHPQ